MNRKWVVRMAVAGVFSIGFFAMLTLLALKEVPAGNRDVLITLLGALGGAVITIVSFYFGDSEGNSESPDGTPSEPS